MYVCMYVRWKWAEIVTNNYLLEWDRIWIRWLMHTCSWTAVVSVSIREKFSSRPIIFYAILLYRYTTVFISLWHCLLWGHYHKIVFMTISLLPLFCKKGTNYCILSNRESATNYKTEAMCKGKQMIVSFKIIVSILEIHVALPLQHM